MVCHSGTSKISCTLIILISHLCSSLENSGYRAKGQKLNDKDRQNVLWLCQKHIFGIYVLQASLQPVYLLVHFIFTRIFSQVPAQFMLHGNHSFSESLQRTIQSCSLIFLSVPVVRDNLQCIFRWDKDPSGKSFCSWIERATGSHSCFPETQQTPSSRKRPFVHYWRKLFGPCKFHPESICWCFQLRLQSWHGAGELH